MNDWEKMKDAYIKDHLSKDLKQPQRRLNALSAIEKLLKENMTELMSKDRFQALGKEGIMQQLLKLKKSPLSSAEKSVIVGLIKFM